MLRLLLLFCIVSIPFSNLKANEVYTFTPPKNHFVKGTYSSEMQDGNSFHLVIMSVKGEKTFKIQPVHIKSNGSILEFKTVTLNHEPKIISHHEGGEMMSFIDFDEKNEMLSVFDFNTTSLTVDTSSRNLKLEELQTVIRLNNKTVLLNLENNKSFSTIVIEGQNALEKVAHSIPKEQQLLFKKLKKEGLDAINQNEYTEKGSINKNKIFINDGRLSFIFDDEKEISTKVISTLLNEDSSFDEITINPKETSTLEKIKNYNTYLHKNQIFSVASNKESMELLAFDADNGEMVKKINVDDIVTKNSEKLEDYLKATSKGKIKSTITVSNTEDGNIVLRLDQADKTSYRYNYNWWWHHHWMMQQNMMMQQQMLHQQMRMQQQMNTIPRGFGPNPALYDTQHLNYINRKEPESIKIVLDKSTLNILPDASDKTTLNEVDREKHLKPYEKDNNKRNVSATFSKNAMHCIYQDRKSKEIRIQVTSLN